MYKDWRGLFLLSHFGMFGQYSKHSNHNSTVQDVCKLKACSFLICLTRWYFCQWWTGRFLLISNPVKGCRCASWCDLSFGSANMCSPAIFETCFYLDKDIWIASTDYYMYFYIIVLLSIPFSSILINFTAS